MTLHRLAGGEGTTRDVVLVYHIDPSKTGPKVVNACPGACVGVEVFPPSGHYNPGQGLTPVADAIAALRKGEGWELGLLVLVGFSEGCQGVRSALAGGTLPSAVLAVDGIHAGNPPNVESQIAPWRAYCVLAKAQERIAYLTHTQIDIPGEKYLPTKQVVPMVALLGPDAERGEETVPGGPHTQARDGWCFVDGWPGNDKQAHIEQQTVVLPYLVRQVLEWARSARADLPAKVAPGNGAPPPVIGPRPPAPPAPPAPPKGPPAPPKAPPPSSASGDDGAGAAFALAMLGAGLVLSNAGGRRR